MNTKKKTADAFSEGRNPLTPEQAAKAAARAANYEQEASAQILLLCHAFTHEADYGRREKMYYAIREAVAPALDSFNDMIADEMRRQFDVLKGGR